MSRQPALLMLDPHRRSEQMAYVEERVETVYEMGDMVWAAVTEQQIDRLIDQGIHVQLQPEASLIDLPAVEFNPMEGVPMPAADLRTTPPTGEDTAYYIVQFVAPLGESGIAEIEELDGVYVQEVPDYGLIFQLTADQATEVAALSWVNWVGLYHPGYALSYDLVERDTPYGVGELQHLARDLAQADVHKPLIIGHFADVDPEDLRPLIASTGAVLQEVSRQAFVVVATADQLLAIANVPGVQSIELYQPPMLSNQRAGVIVGVDQVRSSGNIDFLVNLDGQGEIVGVIDSGVDHDHPDFTQLGTASATSRITYRWNLHDDDPGALLPTSTEDTPPIQDLGALRIENNKVIIPNTGGPHGTHVTGTIVGNGSHASQDADATHTSQPKGMAPAANVVFHSVRDRNYILTGELDFTNFLTGFLEAHQRGARVHNNSWGGISFGGAARNAYTQSISGVIDRFVFFHPDSLVIFAAGNSEDDRNRNGILDRNRLSQEVVAKNILAVGASENVTKTDGSNQTYRQLLSKRRLGHSNFDALADAPPTAGDFPISDNADQVALFSCRGRVRGTRRIRPDLVAPGTNVLSVRPQDDRTGAPMALKRPLPVTTADGDRYYPSSGTSMAAPVVSGAALLVRQYYRTRFTQLRRLVQLQPLSQLVMQQLAIASHANGVAIAWLQPDNNNFHLVGAVYSNTIRQRGETILARQGPIQPLQANVGNHPAPALARHGDHTLLLYRANDNRLHLQRYTSDLIGDGSFGTSGEVVLSPASRPELDRSPSLLVHGDTIAVLWHGGDSLQFQRFQATTGTAIGGPQVLGNATQTSVHPALIHTGQQYAVAWINQSGNNYNLQAVRIDNNGAVVGSVATLLSQSQEIRQPHLAWNPHNHTFYLVWVTVSNGSDTLQGLCTRPDFTPIGAVHPIVIPVAAAANGPSTRPPHSIRHPRLAAHPSQGLVLTWEDNTQLVWLEDDARPIPQDDEWHPRYDSYLTFLNNAGLPRSPRLRLSDTPENTQGFAALTQPGGTVVTWLSNDEGNSDQLGIYAVKVNEQGAFQSQINPYTPLLSSGRYQAHSLGEFPTTTRPAAVAMAWSGGTYFLLRSHGRNNNQDQLQLIHTNGDGLPEGPLSPIQAQSLAFGNSQDVALSWAGSHLVMVHSTALQVQVGLMNNAGALETRFSSQGLHPLTETPLATIAPQVATLGSGRRLRILVIYGIAGESQGQLRYTVLDRRGNAITRLRDLDAADGTARQGWFHYVPSERRSIAIWHIQSGDRTIVQLNRYHLNGRASRRTPIQLTDLPGSSRNAVVAPRPILFGMGLVKRTQNDLVRWRSVAQAAQKRRQREYGVAWEYRASGTTPSEIRFSRLERDGDVTGTKDVVVVSGDQPATEPQLVWHGDGYGVAWLQPEINNGPQRLFFTIIDENGVRVNLAPTGATTPLPAANHTVSGSGDVQRFHLIWNGRSFRITWTELRSGTVHHLQSAIGLPQPASDTSYDHPFQHPSAALIRATLINGATNLRCTALPNLSNHPLDGYGWGRLNLRQSLSPSPPVTFHVRDDNAVASGATVTHQFSLPPNTRLLRVTLAWTDPPGRRIVNNLNLRITTPTAGTSPAQVYVGNRFQATGELDPNNPCRDRNGNPAPAQFSDPLPSRPSRNPFQADHTVEQIVIPNPPAGIYQVDVIGSTFRPNALQQFPGQPFALVFVGSGEEVRFGNALPTNLPFY